ncbi:hypothetical protein BV22DRAFT_1135831 [Leucogyrophana mollusca]|uniref:Uncharacterized protein n=1 Tax=Leucogyrophana mollusca TaxID=85980 RepID=A0ACB8AVV2_9AGAM|nr:hypothetical protein BV22DRAFT_1135831 [Leucogyrophana mollusca]
MVEKRDAEVMGAVDISSSLSLSESDASFRLAFFIWATIPFIPGNFVVFLSRLHTPKHLTSLNVLRHVHLDFIAVSPAGQDLTARWSESPYFLERLKLTNRTNI